MKTIKIISLFALMFIGFFAYPQQRLIEKGNKEYFRFNYKEAIRLFEAVSEKDIKVQRILADCYMKTEEFENAKVLYSRIIKNPKRTFEDVWHLFQAHLILENYSEAMQLLDLLYELNPEDSRVNAYKRDTTYYKRLKNDDPAFEIRNLKMNDEHQDFAPVLFRGNLLFTSSKNRYGLIRRIWYGNHLPFLNVLRAEIDYDNELIKIRNFDKKYNKKFHDGPISFNSEGTLMVLTRSNYDKRSADGTRHLQIFTSEFVDGKWTPLVSFPYNNPEYSVGQASLTPDGKYMYFVSDMPGGIGGTDIYKIERRKDGTWGDLINLEEINTEGNEMFPYYHPSGLLFFSSDGHPGLGGLDLFVTPVFNNGLVSITNLGAPINSSRDDFAFALEDDLEKGYFTSNRADGKGSDDIYFANALRPLNLVKILRGVTKDKNDSIIANANVNLYFDDVVVDSILSDSLGRYEFPIDKTGIYYLTGTKEGYFDGDNSADSDVPEHVIYADLILDKIPVFALEIIVTDRYSERPLNNVKISFTDNNTNQEEILYTDANGIFRRNLDEISFGDTLNYSLRFEKNRYFTAYSDYFKIVDREGIFKIPEKLVAYSDLKVGDDLAKVFNINPIYFDLDKYNIRPDAAIELDKIVEIMNQYPSMVIELGSHTDCRASFEYNMRLSERRARSSAAYIKERITNPDRIYGRGYGESRLVNECACEGNFVVPCTEEQHQMNRRTEFRIIRF